MKIHVTIPQSTYDTLIRFGNINEVVNKVCDLIIADKVPYIDLPALQSRKGHKQFDVYLQNEAFIELYETMQVASKPIRLRRVLQYFVDNEMYVDFEWPIVNEAQKTSDKEIRNISKLCNVIKSLSELREAWPFCSNRIDLVLTTLQGVLNERRQRVNDREGQD